MGGPDGEGFRQVPDFLLELVDLGTLEGESQGAACGAETEGLVGVVHGVGQNGDALEHQALEGLAGEFGTFPPEAGQFITEGVIFHPAVQGPFRHTGYPGGLGDSGDGRHDGQDGPLAGSEGGISGFHVIL